MAPRSSLFALLALAAACSRNVGHGGDATKDDGSVVADSDAADDATTTDAGACTVTTFEGTQDIAVHVMLDRSASMGDAAGSTTKWDAVADALVDFAGDASHAGVGVGLQYFGLPVAGGACTAVACFTDADCTPSACGPCTGFSGLPGMCSGYHADSCDGVDYATPDVAIGDAPAVRATIETSLAAQVADSDSPLSAPLEGALAYTRSWAASHTGWDAAVLLVTDSLPNVCDTDLARIAAISAQGLASSPSTPTYLLAIGDGLDDLEPIAVAGGTTAYHVAADATLAPRALAAMRDVVTRMRDDSCRYPVPTGAAAASVGSVRLRPTGVGEPLDLPRVADRAACGADEGYVVEGTSPVVVRLCPATCATVRGSAGSEVEVSHGCPPR